MHCLHDENFRRAFLEVDRLLCDYRAVWSESPFVHDELGWSSDHPGLFRDLIGLSEGALEVLSDEEELLRYLSSYLPGLDSIATWRIPTLKKPRWYTPQRALFGLPERKKRQTEGFVSSLLPLLQALGSDWTKEQEIVDWCSGRGYLARQLHYASGSSVVCLERDSKLCDSGHAAHRRLDRFLSAQVSFQVQDVLKPIVSSSAKKAYLHTSLHACGDLHGSMLRLASSGKVQAIACAPCCFHSISDTVYSAFSECGRGAALNPSREELRLATAETCTANTLEKELRQRELLWRVAFDLHLRELSGIDEYCPAPSVKKSLLKSSFEEFARSLLGRLHEQGSRSVVYTPLSAGARQTLFSQAKQKLSRIRRLEKARLGFRKALEYWLLLDRALFLQEQGYDVELREFCLKQESGRNIVILATLGGRLLE